VTIIWYLNSFYLTFDRIHFPDILSNFITICKLPSKYISKNAVFRDVVPCRFCVNRRSSETSVHTRSTLRHIPEDGILHNHHRENLKSYISISRLFPCIDYMLLKHFRSHETIFRVCTILKGNYNLYIRK
jgi:hypothetical protein